MENTRVVIFLVIIGICFINADAEPVLLHKDVNYEYYKIPVPASSKMLSSLVLNTCTKNGMLAECPHQNYGDNNCVHASNKQDKNIWPAVKLTKILCSNEDLKSCEATLNMFWYMKSWSSGSACGTTKVQHCSAGKDYTSTVDTQYFAACVKPVNLGETTTPSAMCPPPPTCPTSPPPSTCPTVPAPQTCPTTPLSSTCPPTPTCPTCPDKTCPPTPTYPTPPTCPPTPTCPDKTCPLPSTSSPPTCPPTPTCPIMPEIPTPPTISTCSEKSCPACPTEIAIGTTTSIMADTCSDTGCKNAFNGLGMCVDTSSADFGNVSKTIDFAAGTKEGKCSKDCNCNCFKHTGCYSTKCDESHGICLIPEEEEKRGFFIPNEYSKAFPCDASLNCHCYIKDGVTRSPPEKKEPLSKASCKPSKKCKKSKGNKCFREEDAPKGAQAKGWCNKKKKCRCYKV